MANREQNTCKKQVYYIKAEGFTSLTPNKWYDVLSEDDTCYTVLNDFGNECRYRKERFPEVRLAPNKEAAPKVVCVQLSAESKPETIRVVFKNKADDPNGGPFGASNIYDVDSETENYYYLKVPLQKGEVVLPYRKELLRLNSFTQEYTVKSVILGSCSSVAEEYRKAVYRSQEAFTPKKEPIHTLAVIFPSSSKRYNYLSKVIPKGSYVVVDTPSIGYSLAKVVKVYPNTVIHPAYKYIVAEVDDRDYKKWKEHRKALDDLNRRIAHEATSLRSRAPEEYLRARFSHFDRLCAERDALSVFISGGLYGDCSQ